MIPYVIVVGIVGCLTMGCVVVFGEGNDVQTTGIHTHHNNPKPEQQKKGPDEPGQEK